MRTSTLDQNCELIKDNLIKHLDRTTEIVSKIMNEEMSKGLNILLKPAFKVLYALLIHGGVRNDGIKGIKGIMRICKDVVQENIEPESKSFYAKMKSIDEQFIELDQIGRLCKKNHRNFSNCMEIAGELYEAQIIFIVHLLSTMEPANDYAELCKKAFPKKEDALEWYERQANATKEILKIVEKDLSILNIPVSKSLVYRVLIKGHMEVINGLYREVEEIYGVGD